ncbi:MAG: hypothetical protein GXP00_08375 [Alphaproteobacteria bacterium]|nr:hypothetical protein [Alphaproteobacteria bacterium]
MGKWFEPILKWQIWALPAGMSILLILLAQYSFLTFHTVAELFTITIAFAMFSLAWATYDFSKNMFLLVIASGYLWIGALDFLHMLTYKGMNLFIYDEGNTAVQFWLAARYLEALLLLSAPLLAQRSIDKYILVMAFGAIAICLSIMVLLGYFPVSFVDGIGLSPFKIYSEYIINGIFALSLTSIYYFGRDISREDKILIATAILLTMCAEISFTFYIDIQDISNLVGHIFKLFSFWLIFHAIILSNLQKPYDDLNKNRKSMQAALASAEKANAAKSAFLANMSHDLRTPLNAIIGFSDMMRTNAFGPLGSPHYREYANDIYDSGVLLISLIDDILDISRIEAGKYDLMDEALDVSELINLSRKLLSKMAEDKDQKISVSCPPQKPYIFGDKKILIQLFNNILSNAIKYTQKQGAIEVHVTVDDDNCIVITISDTGAGMTSNEINRALKPFEQLESAFVSKHHGTGLGLYLCVKFMEMLGGVLVLKSKAGKGTSVTLHFPPERTVRS